MAQSKVRSKRSAPKSESTGAGKKISIPIKPHYHDLLRDFGDPAELANYAIESYIVTKLLKYIEDCKAEIKKYESQYGFSYQDFYDKIIDRNGKDPNFIKKLEERNPTYEEDFITWGAFQRELERWNEEMKSILTI